MNYFLQQRTSSTADSKSVLPVSFLSGLLWPRNSSLPRADESHWEWMGLGSGEWSRWVARWALSVLQANPASQPSSGGACVPEPSLSDLLSGESSRVKSESSGRVSFVAGPGARPLCRSTSSAPAAARSQSSSLARSLLRRSLDTPSGIVG